MPGDAASGFIVAGQVLSPPTGLDLTNFQNKEVHRFSGRDRTGRAVTELVVHESVTRSAADTVAVLKRRRLGVHLIVAADGRVTQHGDLAHDRLAHAGGHNGPSVGIEVTNP
jgi:N-acetyl-anhydromuramyl-L-alanine amidase AmpD